MASSEQLREIVLRIEAFEGAHNALRAETTQLVDDLRSAHTTRDTQRQQDHETLNAVVRSLDQDVQEAKTASGQALIAARAADETAKELMTWKNTIEQHMKDTVSTTAAAAEAQQRVWQRSAEEGIQAVKLLVDTAAQGTMTLNADLKQMKNALNTEIERLKNNWQTIVGTGDLLNQANLLEQEVHRMRSTTQQQQQQQQQQWRTQKMMPCPACSMGGPMQ